MYFIYGSDGNPKMNRLSRHYCQQKISSLRPILQRTYTTAAQFVAVHKDELARQARQLLDRSICRDCGEFLYGCIYDMFMERHRLLIVRHEDSLIVIMFGAIFFILVIGLIQLRRHHQTILYGSGCISTTVWSRNRCSSLT